MSLTAEDNDFVNELRRRWGGLTLCDITELPVMTEAEVQNEARASGNTRLYRDYGVSGQQRLFFRVAPLNEMWCEVTDTTPCFVSAQGDTGDFVTTYLTAVAQRQADRDMAVCRIDNHYCFMRRAALHLLNAYAGPDRYRYLTSRPRPWTQVQYDEWNGRTLYDIPEDPIRVGVCTITQDEAALKVRCYIDECRNFFTVRALDDMNRTQHCGEPRFYVPISSSMGEFIKPYLCNMLRNPVRPPLPTRVLHDHFCFTFAEADFLITEYSRARRELESSLTDLSRLVLSE